MESHGGNDWQLIDLILAQEEKEEQEFGGPVEISVVQEKTPSGIQKGKPSSEMGINFNKVFDLHIKIKCTS